MISMQTAVVFFFSGGITCHCHFIAQAAPNLHWNLDHDLKPTEVPMNSFLLQYLN